jgi:hypothetical protein
VMGETLYISIRLDEKRGFNVVVRVERQEN